MAVILRSGEFIVGTGWLLVGAYIQNTRLAQRIAIERKYADHLALVMVSLRRYSLSLPDREALEAMLMARFLGDVTGAGTNPVSVFDKGPDQLADQMVLALDLVRDPVLANSLDPLLSPARPKDGTIFFDNPRYEFSFQHGGSRFDVLDRASGRRITADAAQVDHLRATLRTLNHTFPAIARQKIYLAFCTAVCEGPASPVYRLMFSQSPRIVAETFARMPMG